MGKICPRLCRQQQRFAQLHYCYDDNDPDRIIVFGLVADQASNQEFVQQPWFADYQRETQALPAEPGEVRRATPQYVKAAQG